MNISFKKPIESGTYDQIEEFHFVTCRGGNAGRSVSSVRGIKLRDFSTNAKAYLFVIKTMPVLTHGCKVSGNI
jgi:hypothetical protein